ncbi:acyl-ACP--UDP-N- acetylglucosamine O-acyltransferase [Rhodococcus sp. BP-149]|uniref:acyl-ACP--UDP-N- acetylglucosamine O-acyltransferase n=1 Tax=unclassified Rhodococcus (in: high G+C Gram-positive bacteria) TaxID=192944 RepID=UPI001C9BBA3F|nr:MULTISPECIES: acyl-ACP--UDP-N- acetylglucosamine O-acyltransferase [unclassified Rhodococcus (in: high G+C Gram-positive bacteria)]MBY6687708.1 acyl-ACP--UDP-N- acetylglucosamine O-acyltransferase [Rhodococcus sp. BP-288]MBY6695863.1 acyl-ACP--UDP-N- acetylglucosamine O-acyltransferase [Rhodococcus sp. BP-188]MBY6700329.1 acyl-ACP--UDP-N- acetylglucosamine O-acyltransferase [Rhodococcus sp. BP-285]MBY6704648.1 acyl-ACP--UDP-N- acetylglucosamine O-acyltransferase [Rhodococcus sp. BP-283]MBY6
MPFTQGRDCHIHPTASVGDGVQIGHSVVIGAGAVLLGPLQIGSNSWIGPYAVLGTPPEILGWSHSGTPEPLDGPGILVGENTVLREMCVVHRGSERTTEIGPNSFLMNRVSVEHDVRLGERTVAAAGVVFAGHVIVGDGCNMGVGSMVHQRRTIGSGAMVGMGSVVVKDVPPFATAAGNPVRLIGANVFGMKRNDHLESDVSAIDSAYSVGQLPDPTTLSASIASMFTQWCETAGKPLVE